MTDSLNSYTKKLAAEIGFDRCAVLQCGAVDGVVFERFGRWLGDGCGDGLGYMSRNLDKRENPTLLVDGAKMLIVTLVSYVNSPNPPSQIVARYARGEDYHVKIKRMLMHLLEGIRAEVGEVSGRAFVDSAPVMERSWAVMGGLGWIGRNSLLINKELGSYTNIGVLIIDAKIEPDTPQVVQSLCGDCRRCVDACPLGAMRADRTIDPRRCMAYYTTQHRGEIPAVVQGVIGERVKGCDLCQECCPFNGRER